MIIDPKQIQGLIKGEITLDDLNITEGFFSSSTTTTPPSTPESTQSGPNPATMTAEEKSRWMAEHGDSTDPNLPPAPAPKPEPKPAPAPKPEPKSESKPESEVKPKPKPKSESESESESKIQVERTPTFQDTLQSARNTLSKVNASAVYGMKEGDAISYAKRSISDMEQKMAQIASYSLGNMNDSPAAQAGGQVANSNNSMNSYTNNITQTMSDHLRNLRSDYERLPQWRVDMG